MRLKQISGSQFIREESRRALESAQFGNLGSAQRYIEKCFPNHLVVHGSNSIVVTNKDKSLAVATFKPL